MSDFLAGGPRPARVFVVNDHMLPTLLAEVVEDLQGRGVEVFRGPPSRSGDVPAPLPAAAMEQLRLADVAVFSSRTCCTADMLASAPRLRAVVNPSIGVENVDVRAASELGILVGNGATRENQTGMAEAAVMLMLNLFYALRTSERYLQENRPRPGPGEVHARTLHGKAVGILGLGHIGRAIVGLLEPFGVHIRAYSPHADPSEVPDAVRLASFEDVMSQSDVVCICIAVTGSNRRLINERALRMMKPAAFLINIARGDAVDEPALIRALRERWIAGAALDTFAQEPLPMDSLLRELDNVILTPHMVGNTQENMAALRPAAIENIRRIVAGEPPLYCKNPAAIERWRARIQAMERLDAWDA